MNTPRGLLTPKDNPFEHADFEEAPFVERGPIVPDRPMTSTEQMRQNIDQREHKMLKLFDPSIEPNEETMNTWQLIMCEISIIQRLEVSPSVKDIVRMIKAAEKVQELAPKLVEDMKGHRQAILRELGVEE